MAIPTLKVEEEYEEDWVDLEDIFIGRTVHLHSLSPLHPPLSSSNPPPIKRITKTDLNLLAQQLQNHLNARLNHTLFAVPALSGVARTRPATNTVSTRASFIDGAGLASRKAPKPFVIEIQLARTIQNEAGADQDIVESGHLLFLSTPQRQSPTHYPLLLWKAPPSGRAAPLNDGQAGVEVAADGAPITVTSRLLTSETLSFVTAYFDCRLSTLPPLHGIRGKNLEDIAESVIAQRGGQRKQMAMELTFALPSQIHDADGASIDGPAPDLNTINLTIPGPIMEELLTGTALDAPIMPAIRHYLSSHTSIHLSRLTLTRLGISNVYLGAPASIKTTGGEVRLKISHDADGQPLEVLILTVLRELIRIAGEEEW